jgi:hypothetical protein
MRRRNSRSRKTKGGISADAYTARVQATRRESNGPHYVTVHGLTDQIDERSVLLTQNGSRAIVRLDVALGSPIEFARAAAKQGVILADTKARNEASRQIGLITEWPQTVYVVKQPGLHCGAFVKPDGGTRGTPTVEHFQVALTHPVQLTRVGTLEGWQELVARFASGQSILILAFSTAFLGPLLEVMPGWDNVLIELVAATSTGKTNILSAACTVWGAPHRRPGSISKSFRTTDNALEENMLARGGAFCTLNEVNLLGSEKQLGSLLSDFAFLLEEGAPKDRKGQETIVPVSLCAFGTSNHPVPDLMAGQSPERIDAVRVRLATVNADTGSGYRGFDHLPEGFNDGATAINALRDGLLEHHGHAIDPYLDRLAAELARDRDTLVRQIRWWENRFLDRCGVDRNDGAAFRRASIFARIYVAGILASRWGILPLRDIREAILTCYNRSPAAGTLSALVPRVTAAQLVAQYVQDHRGELLDLDRAAVPQLTLAELDGHPGFLRSWPGRRCLLIRTERWQAVFGGNANRMLVELRGNGRLQITDGFQFQTRVRRDRSKDRVYAIIIPSDA